MNCEWAEAVAMSVDGEVPPELHQHLQTCADCRELLAELQSDQVLLRQRPEVPQGVVTANVLCSLRNRRWRMLLPTIAAALLLVALILPREKAPDKQVAIVEVVPPRPASQPPAPSPVAVAPELRAALRHPHRAVGRTADPDQLMASLEAMLEPASTATASADTPVLITTQTADHDVVIVLVPERKGDEDE